MKRNKLAGLTRREAEDLIATVVTLMGYAKGRDHNYDGPARTHNTYATRKELRGLLADPGFGHQEWDAIRTAARLLHAITKEG